MPGWVYFASAAMLLFYWALDTIDGKQARKTLNSTQLGQLLDHGTDSFCCAMTGLFTSALVVSGPSVFTLIVCHLCFIPFFFSNWLV